MIANHIREALKKGETVKGFNVFESLRPSVVKVAAQAGFDFIMVDTEHVVHNDETFTNFLVLARDNHLAPLVTVVSPDRPAGIARARCRRPWHRALPRRHGRTGRRAGALVPVRPRR